MGLCLAEEDLKMRGSGEIFGTRQSGIPEFQVADIGRRLSHSGRSAESRQPDCSHAKLARTPRLAFALALLRKERTFRLEYKKGVEWKFLGFHSTPFKMVILRALYLDEMRQDEGRIDTIHLRS